jgi:hypothetical protein
MSHKLKLFSLFVDTYVIYSAGSIGVVLPLKRSEKPGWIWRRGCACFVRSRRGRSLCVFILDDFLLII